MAKVIEIFSIKQLYLIPQLYNETYSQIIIQKEKIQDVFMPTLILIESVYKNRHNYNTNRTLSTKIKSFDNNKLNIF